MAPAYIALARVKADVGWHFKEETGEMVGRVSEMSDVAIRYKA